MALQYAVDDSEWGEVRFINGYALFMGYLMMGVRGVGLLVITWTTVVLLGGFVTALAKKDFWCLTGIVLIQISGVFNFLLKEKINDAVHSWWGLVISVVGTFISRDAGLGRKRRITFYVLVAIQVLVFGVILCALGVVYMLGMYISAGVSLWRLIDHNFGDAGGANQSPALEVLYILAVAQGVLFGYKTIFARVTQSRLSNAVKGDFIDKKFIEEYIEETVAGCEKNLSFARGRNLITYGVDLMTEAKSNQGFIAGIKILGGALKVEYLRLPPKKKKVEYLSSAKVLAKYLLTRSDSSRAITQRLLETVGPRSTYSREIKEHVVRILDIIAGCIPWEQLPRTIEYLCSVVDRYEDTKEQRRYGNKFMDYERAELFEEYEKDYIELVSVNNCLMFFPCCRGLFRSLNRCICCFKRLSHWIKILCMLCLSRDVVEPPSPMFPEFSQNGGCNGETRGNEKKEDRMGFDQLLQIAANIIYKLVADEGNRWIVRTCVSDTMIHKIAMFPGKLHWDNHAACNVYQRSELQMLGQCWVLTERLLVARTETSSLPLLPAATPVGEGLQTRRSEEIQEELLVLQNMNDSALGSSFKRTIKASIERTIKCIFDCLDCRATQKRQAIQILLHLSLDTSFIVEDSESSRRLGWILLLIFCYNYDDSKYWMVPGFTYPNNNCCDFNGIRRLAGQKLSEMLRQKHGELPSEESARELQLVRFSLGDLKSAFDDEAQDISIRTHAVIIMEGLCHLYCHPPNSEVEDFLADAIPKVVNETLILCGSTTAERQGQATDVEKGNVSQDNQDDTKRLRKALASLCLYGYRDLVSTDGNLWSKFEEIATKICKEQGLSFRDFRRLLRRSIK